MSEPIDDIYEVMLTAVRSVRGDIAVKNGITHSDNTLEVNVEIISFTEYDSIYVIGAGKASAHMAHGLEEMLGNRINGGLISTKYGHSVGLGCCDIIEAGHPLPDENSVRAAAKTLALADGMTQKDLVFCLLSGGASALWCQAATPLALEDKLRTTEVLLKCGADIHEMNTVRKHLSAIKGGRLALKAHPARLVTLVISDVIGDDLSAIGSGPTVVDNTTFADVKAIFERYDLTSQLPDAVEAFVNNKSTESPDNSFPVRDKQFNSDVVSIIASNKLALQTAKETAHELGYDARITNMRVMGEAREVARLLILQAQEAARAMPPQSRPLLMLSGGETTVTIRGNGRGGRNQELALAAAIELDGMAGIRLASIGTDGTDGPTEVAGAVVDGATVARGKEAGLDARKYLENNDSYTFFSTLGDLIHTGPTGTNVMDMQIILISRS